MKTANAIRTFMNDGPCLNPEMSYPKISVTEIKEFKSVCTDEEYHDFGRQACEILGEVHEM